MPVISSTDEYLLNKFSNFQKYNSDALDFFPATLMESPNQNLHQIFQTDFSSDDDSLLRNIDPFEQNLIKKSLEAESIYSFDKQKFDYQSLSVSPSNNSEATPLVSDTPFDDDFSDSKSNCVSCRIIAQECSSCREAGEAYDQESALASVLKIKNEKMSHFVSFNSSDEELEANFGNSIFSSSSNSPIFSHDDEWKVEDSVCVEEPSRKKIRVQLAAPMPLRPKAIPVPKLYVNITKPTVSRNSIISNQVPMSPSKKSADVHKQMERERRRSLRDSMDNLRNTLLLPSDCVEVGVLAAAINCVRELQMEEERIVFQIQQMRQ